MQNGRRWQLWSIIVGLWLLLALPALAQTGNVRIEDPDNLLGSGRAQVQQAAEQLAAEGAEVIVVAAGAAAGRDPQAAERYLNAYLAEEGIAQASSSVNPNQIVFYVARDARITGLFYGTRWRETLDPIQQRVRDQTMTPQFAAGNITAGFVDGINAVRTTINPPTSPVVYVIGGVLAVTAVGAVALPLLRKRRVAADTLAAARERFEQARRAAGSAIADLGQLVEQAQEKAKYDQISYSAADVQRVQSLQSQGLSVFQEAQAAFDDADEQQNMKPPTSAQEYETLAARYNQAQELAQQATRTIREVEALRAALDARGTPSTGPTQRLDE